MQNREHISSRSSTISGEYICVVVFQYRMQQTSKKYWQPMFNTALYMRMVVQLLPPYLVHDRRPRQSCFFYLDRKQNSGQIKITTHKFNNLKQRPSTNDNWAIRTSSRLALDFEATCINSEFYITTRLIYIFINMCALHIIWC